MYFLYFKIITYLLEYIIVYITTFHLSTTSNTLVSINVFNVKNLGHIYSFRFLL